jgi:hypothetical protein
MGFKKGWTFVQPFFYEMGDERGRYEIGDRR